MQYIIILPGESKRLPTAAQLRRAGFRISEAVAPRDPAQEHRAGAGADNKDMDNALALAAEECAAYGPRHG